MIRGNNAKSFGRFKA